MSAYLPNWLRDTTIPTAAELHRLMWPSRRYYTVRRLSDGEVLARFPRVVDGRLRAEQLRAVIGRGECEVVE